MIAGATWKQPITSYALMKCKVWSNDDNQPGLSIPMINYCNWLIFIFWSQFNWSIFFELRNKGYHIMLYNQYFIIQPWSFWYHIILNNQYIFKTTQKKCLKKKLTTMTMTRVYIDAQEKINKVEIMYAAVARNIYLIPPFIPTLKLNMKVINQKVPRKQGLSPTKEPNKKLMKNSSNKSILWLPLRI